MEVVIQLIAPVIPLAMGMWVAHVMEVVTAGMVKTALAMVHAMGKGLLVLVTLLHTILLVIVIPRSMPLMYGYSIKYFKERRDVI